MRIDREGYRVPLAPGLRTPPRPQTEPTGPKELADILELQSQLGSRLSYILEKTLATGDRGGPIEFRLKGQLGLGQRLAIMTGLTGPTAVGILAGVVERSPDGSITSAKFTESSLNEGIEMPLRQFQTRTSSNGARSCLVADLSSDQATMVTETSKGTLSYLTGPLIIAEDGTLDIATPFSHLVIDPQTEGFDVFARGTSNGNKDSAFPWKSSTEAAGYRTFYHHPGQPLPGMA